MYDQDEYIGLDQYILKISSEDVWLRQIYLSWSSKCIEEFLKTTSEGENKRGLEDVFKTSSSRGMFAGNFFKKNWYIDNKNWLCKK